MINLLWSDYILDGVRMDSTPGEMLSAACGSPAAEPEAAGGPFEPAVDETVDPAPATSSFSATRISRYLEGISQLKRKGIPDGLAGPHTRFMLAKALIDAIWRQGHFRLGDLCVSAQWEWDDATVGRLAAFYESVAAACDYLDSLGLRLEKYSVSRSSACRVSFKVTLDSDAPVEGDDLSGDDIGLLAEIPFKTSKPRLGRGRKCPETLTGNSSDWLIYIPFDTCTFRLGGSLLAQATGQACGQAPEILDPDYFIDSYEVVRELVEDGIVTSGVTVGDGGLLAALRRIVPEDLGLRAELGGIRASYGEDDPVRILFSEVPGVVIEVRDSDYDYLDAELLLQDIAYYPLGHARKSLRGILPVRDNPSDISGILQALLESQAPEGED